MSSTAEAHFLAGLERTPKPPSSRADAAERRLAKLRALLARDQDHARPPVTLAPLGARDDAGEADAG